MTETITLRPRQGEPFAGEADVRRPSESGRIAKALAFALGGLLLGAGSIFIPIAHFVTTWALPLAGLGMAAWTMSVKAVLEQIRGTCPACAQPFAIDGGPVEDPMWVRCPRCKTPLQVLLAAPPPPAR